MLPNSLPDRRQFLRRLALLAGSLTLAGISGCDRAESQTPRGTMKKPPPPKPGQKPAKPRG